MRTAIKTTLALLIAGASIASLSACSDQQAETVFGGGSEYAAANTIQLDTYHNAVPGIDKALKQGKSLTEIRGNLNHYLKPSLRSEQVNLIDGSCGLTGPKDYTLAVGNGHYIYVYTSRTQTFNGGFDKTLQALITKSCGVFSLDTATPTENVG